ncbi:MAG: proprotein convertase P-domain-containing protein, partial [Flavobacteriales bacterium]
AGTVAWTSISNFGGTDNCVDVAIAPSDNNVMYVSRYDGEFYRTANAQAGSPNWTDLSANLPSTSTPKDIEIDPLDEDHLFIAVSLDIYESTDGGQSWSNYSGSLPNVSLNTIVIDQNSPAEAMYVGMDLGVYYRDMNSADWEAYYTGLPNIEVTELEIYYNTTDCRSAIFAATYAQGLWKSDLKDPGTVAPIACFESDVQVGCTATPITFTDLSSYTPTGWTWSFTPNTVTFVNGTSANSETPEVTFNATGLYSATLTVTNANGSDSELKTDYISIINSVLATPTLTTPANAATDVAPPVSFSWSAVAGTVITYGLDIATDAAFSSIVDAQTGLTTNSHSSSNLNSNTTYYWRVKAFENCAESSFTSTFSFTTGNCAVVSSADVPVVISSSGTPTVTSDLVFGTSGAITSISVASLDIPHTWINDIVVTLESPDGTVITLIDRICAGENDIDVILYDGAPTSINGAACPPNGGGSYQPEDALAAFIGEEASGTWTLSATDHVNQDGGSIDGWSLAICTNSPTCTDPTVPTLSFDTDPICPGATTNLNISGTLNDATSWEVYSTNCGTGLVGSTATSTLSISPSANTTYYVRGEGGCVTPGTCADATITVDDSVNPTITCPANATVNVNGSCQISLADYTGSATVNDNCDSSPAVTQSPAAATLLSGSGTTQTITLTATDASTNSANCTFELTLNDNTNPTITCPSTVTVTANAATCLASPALGSPTTADNCTVGVITNDAPATFPVGNTAVTWTVTDGNSNSANCTQTVTVNTNIPTQPTAISGTNSVCSGDTETYSVTAVADASSYTWSLPSGWTG